MKEFNTTDYVVFTAYVLVIIFIGLWVSRTKKGEQKTSQDYFLASRSLPWWAIGSTLLAANISAEHFIAMSGSGYAIGLAIAAYEWIAAITLIFVAKFFLPVFIGKGITTMPQFLNERYDRRVSSCFAVFWILVYIFVNMTSVIYLGALAMERIIGIPLVYGVIGFSFFSAVYSLWGGMKAVAWTDVINVLVLIIGGLVTTGFALNALSDGHGVAAGFRELLDKAPQKFHLIIEKGTLFAPDGKGGLKDAFSDLPGLAVVMGSMWLTNLSFWGFNQFIIQRGLAGKSLKEAQLGVVFAAYLKLLIPLLVVIPGITVFALGVKLGKSDEAYPWLIRNIIPAGITGLSFAAIAAAAVSSISSIVNSTSTIFTIDIYKAFINKNATEKQLVRVGMIVAFTALIISTAIAPRLRSLDQAYQYIQEYTGFIYPGEFLIFFCGLFWKKASSNAALWTALLTIPLGMAMKVAFPEMPFVLRIGYVFIILFFVMVGLSLMDKKNTVESSDVSAKDYSSLGMKFIAVAMLIGLIAAFFVHPLRKMALEAIYVPVVAFILLGLILIFNKRLARMDRKAILIGDGTFSTTATFNIAATGVCGILAALYFIFW
ncbi:MAG TPA: sodium/solute symporter [Bacteroidales bacterium]|nr:sodium/solute symporter [Bacteroidales bacterium]